MEAFPEAKFVLTISDPERWRAQLGDHFFSPCFAKHAFAVGLLKGFLAHTHTQTHTAGWFDSFVKLVAGMVTSLGPQIDHLGVFYEERQDHEETRPHQEMFRVASISSRPFPQLCPV